MNRPSSKTSLLIIFITVFIDLLGFGIVLPLLPRYAKHFEAGGLTLGLLMGSFSCMQFLFAPIWGRISDRIGRRPVLILGLFGSMIFYSLFGYATSLGSDGTLLGLRVLPWLFICRIAAGIAGATIPTAQAYIADVTGAHDRAKGMALVGAAFGIGFTFGPLLGAGFVRADTGDPGSFSQPSMIALLQLTTGQQADIHREITTTQESLTNRNLSRNERGQLKDKRDARVLALLNESQRTEWRHLTAPSAAPGYVAGFLSGLAWLFALLKLPESLQPGSRTTSHTRILDLQSLKLAVNRPEIVAILATMFLTTFAFAQFESTLSLLTEALGLADRYNYYVFAYIGFILSLAQGGLVRRLLPKLGEFKMSAIGTILMTLGFLLIGVSGMIGPDERSRHFLYWVLPLTVVGFSALNPSLQSLLSRRSAATQQGGILGLGQSMAALARILGPVVGLILNDWDLTAPYWAAAAIMALGIAMTLRLRAQPLPEAPSGEAGTA